MQRKTLQQLVIAGSVCAATLFASDVWNTKDHTQWSSEDTYKLLTDSPWAKQKNVTSQQSGGGQQRGSQGGGGGRRSGGIGFPGGGYPGGGGGYPGGGGGYPGGGGGRRGGGYPNDGSRGGARSMNVTLRWESALPLQHALMRQGVHSEEDSKTPIGGEQKYYVLAVMGLQIPSARSGGDADDYDLDGDNKNSKSSKSNDELRSRLMDAAQLIPKSKTPIAAEDVQLEGRNGSVAIRFLFPRTFPITAEDKEITFHFESRGMKLEQKFKLGDMMYQGKLAL
jgi:hypothetical protein